MALSVDIYAVADYLGIDAEEVDETVERNIRRQLPAADRFLQSAIGKDYDTEDPRAQELAVMTAGDLYSSRGILSAKQESSLRRLAADFMQQMRLEMRGDD